MTTSHEFKGDFLKSRLYLSYMRLSNLENIYSRWKRKNISVKISVWLEYGHIYARQPKVLIVL